MRNANEGSEDSHIVKACPEDNEIQLCSRFTLRWQGAEMNSLVTINDLNTPLKDGFFQYLAMHSWNLSCLV